MTVKCEYCEQQIDASVGICPYCGAPNVRQPQKASKVPQTIEELQAFAADHKLPLEQMRVYLGRDYRGAKAFGIYRQPDGTCVVYKNKADGSRAVRYQGPDEAHAVRELYLKMKEMMTRQREYRAATRSTRAPTRKAPAKDTLGRILLCVMIGVVVVGVLWSVFRKRSPSRGYYRYNDDYYYSQDGDWYRYDSYAWVPILVEQELMENYDDYYVSSGYSSSFDAEDFRDSDFYQEPREYDDDDDDFDWDWDDDDGWDDVVDWDDDW